MKIFEKAVKVVSSVQTPKQVVTARRYLERARRSDRKNDPRYAHLEVHLNWLETFIILDAELQEALTLREA